MPLLKNYKKYKPLGHILFWLCSIIFAVTAFYVASDHKLAINSNLLLRALIPNIGFALAVYLNLYVLVPRFLKTGKYIFYTFWLILVLAASSLLIQSILAFGLKQKSFENQFTEMFSYHFFTAAFYVGMTSLVKFIKDWVQLQQIKLKYAHIEREKLEAELSTLKSQLNPHFLFNCLNNIYSLALLKSPQTPEVILKLSDLMRYVLYESRENFIPVKKELDFMANFIELQKIRLNDKIDIQFEVEDKIPDLKVIPLLFEPFIDNAFKHGLRNPARIPFIHISINFLNDNLRFKITNNFQHTEIASPQKDSGIGLQNIKRRLSYLYKPDDYRLEMTKSDNIFNVTLEVRLK